MPQCLHRRVPRSSRGEARGTRGEARERAAQVRGIEDVSWCSIVGIAGMLLALGIAAVKLVLLRAADYTPTQWLRKCAPRLAERLARAPCAWPAPFALARTWQCFGRVWWWIGLRQGCLG
jgi:hypothetical protein